MGKTHMIWKWMMSVVLAGVLLLTGCGSAAELSSEAEAAGSALSGEETEVSGTESAASEEAEAEVTETPTPEPTPEPHQTIGLTEGAEQYRITLVNETGQDITEISVRADGSEEFAENLIGSGEAFPQGELRDVYFAAEDPSGCAVRIVLADASEYILNAVPVEDIGQGEIRIDKKIAFLEYVPVGGGDSVSTEQDEIRIIQEEAAAAEAARIAAEEEAARKAAEEEAARQAAEEAARQAAEAEAARQAAEEAARQAQQAQQQQQQQQQQEDCLGQDALVWD